MRKPRRKYKPAAQPVPGQARTVRRQLNHRRQIDAGKAWFVVRAQGGGRKAAASLQAEGFDVFHPADDCWRVYRWRCSDVSAGLFRGYLFVGFEGSPRFDKVRDSDGVHSILEVSGTPISLAGEILQEVADRHLGPKITHQRALSAEQTVSVARGAFAELVGQIIELDHMAERALVRIRMMGRDHEVELGFNDLKVA